ncbi:response regulator [Endozoicomonadaceae bacterium StTr2]
MTSSAAAAKTIIIAEDHPLFRSALKLTLDQVFDQPVFVEAETIAELQTAAEVTEKPDLILLDLNMPGAHGFSGLVFLHGRYPEVPVAVITANEDDATAQKAARHGARAFIPKSARPETIKEALLAINNGERWFPPGFTEACAQTEVVSDMESRIASLTPQQFRVLGMISEGMLNKQIAYDLEVSEATIKAHVTAIFRKLGVRSRTQAVIALQSLELEDKSSPDNTAESPSDTPE